MHQRVLEYQNHSGTSRSIQNAFCVLEWVRPLSSHECLRHSRMQDAFQNENCILNAGVEAPGHGGFRGCRRCRGTDFENLLADIDDIGWHRRRCRGIGHIRTFATSAQGHMPRHRRTVVDVASLRRDIGADVTEPMSRQCRRCQGIVCDLIGISSWKLQ